MIEIHNSLGLDYKRSYNFDFRIKVQVKIKNEKSVQYFKLQSTYIQNTIALKTKVFSSNNRMQFLQICENFYDNRNRLASLDFPLEGKYQANHKKKVRKVYTRASWIRMKVH